MMWGTKNYQLLVDNYTQDDVDIYVDALLVVCSSWCNAFAHTWTGTEGGRGIQVLLSSFFSKTLPRSISACTFIPTRYPSMPLGRLHIVSVSLQTSDRRIRTRTFSDYNDDNDKDNHHDCSDVDISACCISIFTCVDLTLFKDSKILLAEVWA